MNYSIWLAADVGNTAVLGSLVGFDDDWKLAEGLPVADEFPAEANFTMDPDEPERLALADMLGNRNGQPLVSGRVAEFLRSQAIAGLELLPVAVIDHRGRSVEAPYFLVNPTPALPCLDVDASEPDYNPMDRSLVLTLARLALDATKIPADCRMLRVASVPGPVLVREDLVRELEAQGFTSMRWKDPATYRG